MPRGGPCRDLWQGISKPWTFHLSLWDQQIPDRRDVLVHGRWVIRLIATADDAAAISYDVTIEWSPEAANAQAALESVQITMQRRRR